MQHSVSLYFEHIQPIFPMFQRPLFEQNLHCNRIPDSLLNAMFAISCNFVPAADHGRLFGPMSNPLEDFARSAETQHLKSIEGNGNFTLNDIKTACLLALYEYTTYPGRKAWVCVGNLVRLALGLRLHQVDCHSSSIPEAEREEWRFVWWTVYRLDTTINVIASTPFGVDLQSIRTALVSTSTVAFTRGIVNKSSQAFLQTDSVRGWETVQEMLLLDPGDGSHIYLLAVSLLRGVSLCTQRLNTNPTSELLGHMVCLKNAFSHLYAALPSWYFDPSKQSTEDSDSHQRRLETLIMLFT
jgi:hypothetical protein